MKSSLRFQAQALLIALFACLTASAGVIGTSEGIVHYLIGSDTVQTHTMELREAQRGIAHVDAGENIAFVLDNGINVQFTDGSGRRLLVSRGSGYRAFFYPTWSLDGTALAFAGQRSDPRYVDLIVANADGSNATVILTLNAGYFTSLIQSISWSWDHQYLMFNYVYDDNASNDAFVVCTVQRTGQNFVYVNDLFRSYSQYEPVNSSQRYAYVATGNIADANSRLRVSNLNGTNDVVWFTFQGAIAGLTHVSWKSATSIYTIIRNWSQYPNMEVLLRIDKTSGGSTYTVIAQSSTGASLWSPSSSPTRSQFYLSEMTTSTSTLYLTTLGSNGLPTSIVAKGTGFYPNWRQQIPSAVSDTRTPGAKEFRLEQNFPNPFNPLTTIRYAVPATGHVSMIVCNSLGQTVSTLVSETQTHGWHVAYFDGTGLASGVYFVRLETGSHTATRKLVLVK
jgi:hypothetical protein